AVEEVGHAAQEQGALADDHDPVQLAGHDVLTGEADVGHAGRDVALGGGPAGEAVLGGEGGQIGPLQLAPLHRQGGDHLVVGQRHVAGAGGLGDVGVLHLGGVLVNVGDLQAVLVQRSGHQAGDDGLGSG